jgi:hypothetical protein
MTFMDKKINRYIIPPFIILLLTGIFFFFSANNSNEKKEYILFGVMIISVITILLYFLFQVITHFFLKNDLLSIFVCSAGSFTTSGMLFRIMHWPGTFMLLTVGSVLLIISFLLVLIIWLKRKQKL